MFDLSRLSTIGPVQITGDDEAYNSSLSSWNIDFTAPDSSALVPVFASVPDDPSTTWGVIATGQVSDFIALIQTALADVIKQSKAPLEVTVNGVYDCATANAVGYFKAYVRSGGKAPPASDGGAPAALDIIDVAFLLTNSRKLQEVVAAAVIAAKISDGFTSFDSFVVPAPVTVDASGASIPLANLPVAKYVPAPVPAGCAALAKGKGKGATNVSAIESEEKPKYPWKKIAIYGGAAVVVVGGGAFWWMRMRSPQRPAAVVL